MRYRLFLSGILILVLHACAEGDGFQTEIDKTVTIDFEFDTNRVFSGTGSIELAESVDIAATEFSEYEGQIRDFAINKLSFQITGYQAIPGNVRPVFHLLDFDLRGLQPGAATVDMIEIEELELTNHSTPVVLYRPDSTNTSELVNAMNFVRVRLLQNQPFLWEASGDAESIPGGQQFRLSFLLDITASVVLE